MRAYAVAAFAALSACASIPGPFIRYTLPPGWTAAPSSEDRAVELRGPDEARVVMRSLAGDPEKHTDFLALKRAPWDGNGRDASPREKVRVAGSETQIWRRESHLLLEPTATTTYYEDEFCVVPRSAGFVLAHYSRESQGSPFSPGGEARRAEWRALLESLH
jgi:hypothetical protein